MIAKRALVAACATLLGCGANAGGAPGGDGGTTGADVGGDDTGSTHPDGGGPADGAQGQGDDAGVDGAQGQPDAFPSDPYWGQVVIEDADDYTGNPINATIDVYMYPYPVPSGSCPTGSCCWYPNAAPPADAGAPPADAGASPGWLSAGPVTLTQDGKVFATVSYGAQGYYSGAQFPGGAPWLQLHPVQIAAPGATVGSFSGTIVPPVHPVGLTPTFANTVTASMSKGLTVTWQPEAPGTRMLLDLSFTSGDVYCYADDSAGQVFVPPAMVAHASPGGAQIPAIGIMRVATAWIQGANANIELLALAEYQTQLQIDP
jgi:hypothetical protein